MTDVEPAGLPPPRPPIDASRLRALLIRPGSLWTSLRVVGHTESTNADVAELAGLGATEGLIEVAEFQTAGRGRYGHRQWLSPPGSGLLVSLLLRPEVPRPNWSWLPLLAGTALAEAVKAVCGVDAGLKWPNDVVVGAEARKLAGLLVEVVGPGAIVLGFGLNVSTTRSELPGPQTTSLLLEGATLLDREAVLTEVLERLATRYVAWRRAGGDAVRSDQAAGYLRICRTVGAEITVTLPGGRLLTGTGIRIDASGSLVVLDSAGAEHVVAAGDVMHVRPGRADNECAASGG